MNNLRVTVCHYKHIPRLIIETLVKITLQLLHNDNSKTIEISTMQLLVARKYELLLYMQPKIGSVKHLHHAQ